MIRSFDSIATMFPGYFSEDISEGDRNIVDSWRQESPEHEREFREFKETWDAYPLLHEMEKYNAFEALQKVHKKIHSRENKPWILILQRIAAIIAIPLLLYSGYLTINILTKNGGGPEETVWQTITTPPGVKSHFYLPDSTSVWLNSSSSVTYPLSFSGESRQIKVTGEAFLDVKNKATQPFIVTLGKINVKVLGTRFSIINYEQENQTDVILESGSISLFQGSSITSAGISNLKPGELARYDQIDNSLKIKKVHTDKYTSWINGKLIFRDDPMEDVVRRLNHWFNVQIEVADPEILDYVYTATFTEESIDQILELLTMSAPISYQVIQREKKGDVFSAKRIILKKRGKK
jgi:ferric-dicitrate binding protein FerR (iron transport regulator)